MIWRLLKLTKDEEQSLAGFLRKQSCCWLKEEPPPLQGVGVGVGVGVVKEAGETIPYYLQCKTVVLAAGPHRNAHLCLKTAHRLDEALIFVSKTLQHKP